MSIRGDLAYARTLRVRRPHAGEALAFGLALTAMFPSVAFAQRTGENAVRMASDAFGTNIGNEQIGLYSGNDARGFSPAVAGNARLEGFYIDAPQGFLPRLISGSQVRVGLTAQSYPFPAPTGIVDYRVRPAGDTAIKSVFASLGPFTGYEVDVDAQQPLIPHRLSLGYGLYYTHYDPLPNDNGRASYGYVLSPRWTPRDGIEIRAFYGATQRQEDKGSILIFPGGPVLPPQIAAKNFSPEWLGSENLFSQGGLYGTSALGRHWTLRAGGFYYRNDSDGVIADSYLGVDATGLATTRRFTNQKPFDYVSWSDETRLTGVFAGDDFRHTLHFTLRGRDVQREYGGAAVAAFSSTSIGQYNAPPEPFWTYGRSFDDSIRQWSAGAAYQLAYRRLGEMGFGLQRVDYQKTLIAPGGLTSVVRTEPWLGNGNIAINVTERLALYAAFTRGLEEAPVAPEVAANAAEPPPAIRTRQHEFGARFVLRPNLRLVIGYFDVRKPYFNLDGAQEWRQLGEERHSGLEVSLAGEVAPGLSMVAGYVHQEPTVSGEAVRLGIIADNPVGQPRDTARLGLDYRPGGASFSIDGALNYYGARPVSSRGFAALGGRQLEIDSSVTADVGVRQRFRIDGHPATLRALVQNVAGEEGWNATTSGGLSPISPRRFSISLTADF